MITFENTPKMTQRVINNLLMKAGFGPSISQYPRFFAITAMAMMLLFAVSDLKAQEKVFKAGASVSNITPSLGGGIIGNFGTPPPAEHVHDQLHVRSLAL